MAKISDSLNTITSFLREENARLDQEIKDKQLDVFIKKAGDKFSLLEADSTADDARNTYFELMGIAGNLNVGKEAVPFLNQMLSSSVAFIKDEEAKRYDSAYRTAMNKTFGYEFGPGIKGQDAANIIGTDFSNRRREDGFFDAEGKQYVVESKLTSSGYTEVKRQVKDERTDAMRLKQEKELLSYKQRVSNSGRQLDIRPSTYTFTTEIDNKKMTLPVDWAEDMGYFFRDPNTGKRLPANINEGTFDVKTPSTTVLNTTRNGLETEMKIGESTMQTYGSSLSTALLDAGFDKKKLYNMQNGQQIKGNEAYLYGNRDKLRQEILGSGMDDAEKTNALGLLDKFNTTFENYNQSLGRYNEFMENDLTNRAQIELDRREKENDEFNKISSEIEGILMNPSQDRKSYNKISEIIFQERGTYGKSTPYSALGLWRNSQGGLSEEQKKKIVNKIKRYRNK